LGRKIGSLPTSGRRLPYYLKPYIVRDSFRAFVQDIRNQFDKKKRGSVGLTESRSQENLILRLASAVEAGVDRAERVADDRAENH
jgi:hypothetical protein